MDSFVHSHYWPIVVLLLSMALVVVLITRWRFHPFIALMLSAIFVGLISPALPEISGQHRLVTAVELPMSEFGIMAGKIAWVIALAALIGTAMMESGAAERIDMSGFTEREGLKTWTLALAIIALVGLVEILLLAWLFPLK